MKIRKHISQMSKKEIKYLNNKLSHITKLNMTEHVIEKSFCRNISSEDIDRMLKNIDSANIIEYNTDTVKRYNRVLVRTAIIYTVNNESYNLCGIVDIDTHHLVTVYWNKVTNYHSHLDMREYYKSLKIV